MSPFPLSVPDRNHLSAPFPAIHHIALVTTNMERTVTFYRDVLGSRVAMSHRMPRAGNERHYFITIAPNVVFAFFEFPSAELPEYLPPTHAKTGRHLDHIAFYVDSAVKQIDLRNRLIGKVENLTEIKDLGIVTAFFFSDPNGIVLEVMAEVPGRMQFPLYLDPDPISGIPAADQHGGTK